MCTDDGWYAPRDHAHSGHLWQAQKEHYGIITDRNISMEKSRNAPEPIRKNTA
jgi:hypothetical protein